MKKILFIQVLTILILSGCSSKQNLIPDIVLNDSAFIKLTVINCSDTTQFSYRTVPMLPKKCINRKVDITQNGVYYFSHKTTKPDFINLTLRKRFQTYVIPGDTLKIIANLDPDIKAEEAIKIDGVFGEICNFFSKKHSSLGYWDIRYPLTNFSNQSYTLEKAFALNDSLFQSEIDFLNNYKRTNNLPDWFYQIMKADIEYYKVFMRPFIISYRKFFYKENIINPEAYYTFEKIHFYNPKAKLSDVYYACIDIYLGVNHEDSLDDKRGTDRALPMFERSIPDARKILKGDILEYYIAYKISDLFETSIKINELEKVDSLFNSIKNQFTHTEIIEILKCQRDDRAKYLKEKNSANPIVITEFSIDKK